MSKLLSAGLISVGLLSFLATHAVAQNDPFSPTTSNVFSGGAAVPITNLRPAATVATTSTPSTTTEANAATETSTADAAVAAWKAERLQQIKQMDFDRRPSAILALWSRKEEPEPAEPVGDAAAAAVDAGAPAESATTDIVANEASAQDANEETLATEAEAVQEQPESTEPGENTSQSDEQAAVAEAAPEAIPAGPTAEEKEAFTKFLTELSESVTRGDWEHFKTQLIDREKLSEEEAIAIYERLLAELTEQADLNFEQVVGLTEEMQQFLQATMANRRNNPAARYAEQHSLQFSDLMWILRSCPVKLRDADLNRIATMLRTVVSQGNQLNDFVTAIDATGEELIPRQKIALLLSAAGSDDQTAKFLPSLEEAKQGNDAQVLNLLARHFLSLHSDDSKQVDQERAWEATLAALTIAEAEKDQRSEALTRAVQLAPRLRKELGQEWLKSAFTTDPTRGQEILASIGTATAQRLAQTPQDASGRTGNLELQHAAVSALLDSGVNLDAQWSGILNILANNWLREAEVTRDYSQASSYGSSMRRDRYGNMYYVDPSENDPFGNQQPMRMGQISAIDVEKILDTAPTGGWFDAIDSSIRPQFTMAMCRLWLKVNEDAKAFPYLEQLAGTHPETARELAEEFLRVWTRNHNPNDERQRTNYYMFMYGYEQRAESIPLTRSKQERNLEELSDWIKRLRALPLEGKIDEDLLVSAFMTCHSVAEVFEIERIEQVFGAWESIEPATMAGLVQKMRNNLASVWRDPNVQRDAKTNRKKQDIQQEVIRGYEVAKQVTTRALEQHPGNWQLLVAQASIMHDENAFLNEDARSTEFSDRRRAALDIFRAAANAYLEVAPTLPVREQNTTAFDYWFYASLGATDLGGLSEKNRPVDSEIDEIASLLQGLDGELGTRHRDRFANQLFTRMSAVNPACKFRYLDAGFKIVGENPQAAEAKKVYDYYKDLVTELELVVRVDGSTSVGHDEPFGVYVDLRHTKELERESGGFNKYLQNQNNMYYAYNYGRPTENYRDKFQDAATVALQEHFEVLSVTFNHPETTSRAVKPAGWRVTPYAYILLKARGPEVDKVPSLKIDMDFLDTSGYVVLPITSTPLPIDATGPGQAVDSAEEIKLVQVLDERQATDGKLIVEAKATARGLVPEFEKMLEVKPSEFSLTGVEDSGVSVIEFDKESALPVVLSERTWTLTFNAVDPSGPPPENFAFPTPIIETKETSYQRYVDADLEEVEPTLALVQQYGDSSRATIIITLGAVAGVLLLVGLVWIFTRGGSEVTHAETQTPEAVTPFVVLSRLKAAYANATTSTDKRDQLQADIERVERHYFAESNGAAAPDLEAIAKRWQVA